MKNIKEAQPGNEHEFESLELKANLNPEQREYLEVLKDKMKKVLKGKTKQELAKAGDLESLKKYKAILIQILEFLRTKKMQFRQEFEGEEISWDWNVGEKIIPDMQGHEDEHGRSLDVFFTPDGENSVLQYYEFDPGDYWEIIAHGFSALSEESRFNNLQLSADCSHLAAAVKDERSRGLAIRTAILGDKPVTVRDKTYWSQKFSSVSSVRISPDGEKISVIGIPPHRPQTGLYENDKLVADLDVREVIYSSDSNKKAFIYTDWKTNKNMGKQVIDDGTSLWDTAAKNFDKLVYSRDGQKLAAVKDKKEIIVNNEPIKTNFEIKEIVGQPVFSPNGNKLAYIVKDKNGVRLAENENLMWTLYDRIDNVVYSRDSINIAAVVTSKNEEEGKFRIAINNRVADDGEIYDRVANLTWGPDGKKVMFVARKDKKYYRIVKDVSEFIK